MSYSWKYQKLGSLCKTGAGGTPLKSKKENYENGTIPWLRSGEVNNRNIIDCRIKITEIGLKNSSAKLFPPRTVLIAMYGATAGEVGILNFECSTNQAVCGIIPNENFVPEFLFYFFLKFKEELIAQAVGGAQPNISQQKIKNTLIPNITLEEQKQIVALLDKAFTAIDQAKANIEKNIVNAKELFQSKLNAIFSQRGDGWEEKSLGEICHVQNGYAFKSKETIEASNTQLLRMGNLYKNVLDLDRKPVFYPDAFSEDYKEYLLNEGDLIMSLTGTVDKTDYGYTVKLPKTNVNLLLNQRIMKIEVHDTNVLNKDYLKNYLLSPGFLERLYDTSSGTRQANLSSRIILTLKINFPSDIKKQLYIIKKFKELRDNIVKINSDYNSKLENLEELKKSILQKAFSGELTQKEAVV
jgi:type I restriction enzyme S subunit